MPLETSEDKVEIPKEIVQIPAALAPQISESKSAVEKPIEPIEKEKIEEPPPTTQEINSNLINVCDSSKYKKYFKMLKYGIARTAVKIKMTSEGLDDTILDTPDLLVEKCPEDDEEPEE